MKVLIFGASGIIGQHMRLTIPDGVEAVWYRRTADPITRGFDLTATLGTEGAIASLLHIEQPDAVINLSGESNVDKVEANPDAYYGINVLVPLRIAEACDVLGIPRYVHVSSQAVFSGDNPPYGPDSPLAAVNEYGSQKIRAEAMVSQFACTRIIRPSFILGVRPLPYVGRRNPIEGMLDGSELNQTCDRYFTPTFARDAAWEIWNVATHTAFVPRILHVGSDGECSRYSIAEEANPHAVFEPVNQSSFKGAARRPKNTAYDRSALTGTINIGQGLLECREDYYRYYDRAEELAMFLGISESRAFDKLARGFAALHAEVTEDFHRFGAGENADKLRDWYRTTESYIWELSAYHDDERFNYAGMCKGIADRIRLEFPYGRVACLGDGIGDMNLAMHSARLGSYYHDLENSRTAEYAAFRYWRNTGHLMRCQFNFLGSVCDYEAICAADFLEHVHCVDSWVRAIHTALVPGGLFFAQNAFACGSGPTGSMPMHLAENDHWEHDWDPLLKSVGFEQIASNWYRKL